MKEWKKNEFLNQKYGKFVTAQTDLYNKATVSLASRFTTVTDDGWERNTSSLALIFICCCWKSGQTDASAPTPPLRNPPHPAPLPPRLGLASGTSAGSRSPTVGCAFAWQAPAALGLKPQLRPAAGSWSRLIVCRRLIAAIGTELQTQKPEPISVVAPPASLHFSSASYFFPRQVLQQSLSNPQNACRRESMKIQLISGCDLWAFCWRPLSDVGKQTLNCKM